MTQPRTSDLEAVLALLQLCDEQDHPGSFREAVAAEVSALIPADRVGFELHGDSTSLTVRLADAPGESVCLVLRRPGRPFKARERRLAELLEPALASQYRRVCDDTHTQALLEALEHAVSDPVPPEFRALGLTGREGEVLVAVSRGFTNEQIAFELDVSALTVKKHLEHIYAKLGVSGRGPALARVRASAAEPSPGLV